MDEEELLEEMHSLLLTHLLNDSKQFEQLWVARIVDALTKEGCHPSVSTHFSYHNYAESTSVDPHSVPAALSSLNKSIQGMVDTFLNSADFALCHCEAKEPNRDAKALFDCNLIVSRLVEAESRMSRGGASLVTAAFKQRLAAALRRAERVTRQLAARLATPFHVANCASQAVSLCDVLYTLSDLLDRNQESLSLTSPAAKVTQEDFGRLIERMNEQVVVGLRKLLSDFSTPPHSRNASTMALKSRGMSRSTPSLALPKMRGNLRSGYMTPKRSSNMVSFSSEPRRLLSGAPRRPYGSEPRRGRSTAVLLPFDLRAARSKLPPRPGAAGAAAAAESRAAAKKSRLMIGAIERKWAGLLEAEPIFVRSLRADKDGSSAMRLARSITSEVLEELEKRQEKIAGDL